MKLKATLSDRGLRVLEKGFLPTFDKFGKRLQILVDPESVYFCQTAQDTDGLLLSARVAANVLFEPGNLQIESRCNNQIAFALDTALLLRVLHAAAANDASSLEMRLTMRPYSSPGAGYDMSMVQVEQLVDLRDLNSLCPFYLDIQPEMPRLQILAERLRGLAPELLLSTTRLGDAHFAARVPGLALGSETRGLQVLPVSMAVGAGRRGADGGDDEAAGGTSAMSRLAAADAAGHAVSACTLAKHLSRALQASQFTGPAQLLLGVADDGGFVHLLCIYSDPDSTAGYDDSMSLSFKLPVREE